MMLFNKSVRYFSLLIWVLSLMACTSAPDKDPLLATNQLIAYSSEYAGNDKYIGLLYESRTWSPARALLDDPVELAKRSRSPIP